MSYFGAISAKDSPSVDAFGRWRSSNPNVLFDSRHVYNLNPYEWETIVSGTGAALHVANESCCRLSTGGTGSGAACYRQTRQYWPYQPGKSQFVVFTCVLGAAKANVRQRAGYFDARNGVFFEQTSTALYVVRRTYVSGSAVDTPVAQSSWNLDKLDGAGPSGITLNTSKAQIFVIDLQWLGVGRVRFGFNIGGMIVYCHEIVNANVLTTVYMSTGSLPVRFEIGNTAGAASTTTMDAICVSVMSEGAFETTQRTFSANNGILPIAVTTRRAILSIRPKATLNSIIVRGKIAAEIMDIAAKTNDALMEIVWNPTFTGTPTWTSADAESITEYSVHGDVALGAITAGTVIDSGYAISGAGSARSLRDRFVDSRLPLVLDNAGATPTALSVVCTSMTGASTLNAALTWREIR